MKILNVKLNKNSDEKAIAIIANENLSKSAKIKNLFDLGFEIKIIAQFLNIRYNFAYNVISNYCITDSKQIESTKSESKKDLVKQLFVANKSTKEIAIELKTNYNYIYKIIKELVLSPPSGGFKGLHQGAVRTPRQPE